MNILDIIILICIIPALVQGVRKGFISQVISIISIILGVWISARFANMAGAWLAQWITASGQVIRIIAFTLILITVILVLNGIGKLLERIIKLIMLGWLNKALGVVFSLLKCFLILGLIIMAFNSLNTTFGLVKPEVLADSVLYTPLKDLAYSVFPYIKDLISIEAA